MIYEEIKDDIGYFVKLYKLSKAKGMSIQHVIDVLEIANNDLPSIEERLKTLRNDISMLQFQKRIDERNLYQLNNKIASTIRLLNSFRMSCKRERREIENLYNEKAGIANLVAHFKNNNDEYLKIKQAAEEKIKDVLTNSKLILKFATFSVIESLRTNPELCNFIIYNNSNKTAISYGPNCPSLVSEQRQQSFNDAYTALILEEAEKLYNGLATELTNRIIAATDASSRTSSLL
jgi:hypothetical protein